MAYPGVVKARMVRRLAGPDPQSATQLAKETGIPHSTLSRWLREAGKSVSRSGKSKVRGSSQANVRGSWSKRQHFVVRRGGLSYVNTACTKLKSRLGCMRWNYRVEPHCPRPRRPMPSALRWTPFFRQGYLRNLAHKNLHGGKHGQAYWTETPQQQLQSSSGNGSDKRK